MKNAEAMVKEFHTLFGLTIATTPAFPDTRLRALRQELVQEEFEELLDAEEVSDLVEVADALGDLLYVIIGYAVTYGIPIVQVFAEVHRSNMTKVWSDGTIKRRADGKILKPPTFSPPDLRGVLKRAGYDLGKVQG